mmetsp:Transcript_32282/g.113613  ORF Transcript_32282/g.113613 Transcript_32282/m.113613 type:complete len:113 (+) Transcript_32282:334-672(+)
MPPRLAGDCKGRDGPRLVAPAEHEAIAKGLEYSKGLEYTEVPLNALNEPTAATGHHWRKAFEGPTTYAALRATLEPRARVSVLQSKPAGAPSNGGGTIAEPVEGTVDAARTL